MVRVLVVEDETNIRDMIALNLRHAGMEVVEAESAEAALPLLAQKPGCDAAILDVMLPGMNGFSLCETIRRTDQQIGIIILSAKGQEQDKIRGLSIGADDYMTKPFSVSELLARVEALCRRVIRTKEEDSNGNTPLGTLTSGEFVLDENRRVLLKAGQPIELTQVEFQIMELFFRNPGTALVREKILKGVWGENYFGDVKIVDVNIRRLRMKVEDEPSHPTHIMTVWGYGYRWKNKNVIQKSPTDFPESQKNIFLLSILTERRTLLCEAVSPAAGCGATCSSPYWWCCWPRQCFCTAIPAATTAVCSRSCTGGSPR